ncbi:hypothetical protein ACGLHS_31740 [Variovorax sp. VaC1]
MDNATTAVAGEYLWAMRYALLLIAAYCLLKAGTNAYLAVFLWRNRNIRMSAEIEEVMKDVKPPRYSLMAVCWLVCAGLFLSGAFAT